VSLNTPYTLYQVREKENYSIKGNIFNSKINVELFKLKHKKRIKKYFDGIKIVTLILNLLKPITYCDMNLPDHLYHQVVPSPLEVPWPLESQVGL